MIEKIVAVNAQNKQNLIIISCSSGILNGKRGYCLLPNWPEEFSF